jgi:beta-glucanase (GH16 family)
LTVSGSSSETSPVKIRNNSQGMEAAVSGSGIEMNAFMRTNWHAITLGRTRSRLGASAALAAALALLTSVCLARADTNIVWCDEFNGTTLDTNKWTYDTGNGFWVPDPGYWVGGWGNNELEYYTSRTQNVYVADGYLHLHAQQEAYGGFNFTSGRIKTMDLFAKKYGRLEFRAKLPAGVGFWPAIWMLPQSSPYGGWPNSGEIDIMENNGSKTNQVGGTIHYGGASGHDVYTGQTFYFPGGDSTANFHVYTLLWKSNSIEWSVDGTVYETQNNWWSNIGTSSSTYPYPAPFDQPFYMLINLAIGGNYLGNPSTNQINASLPGDVVVDYVRVYDQTPPLAISVIPQTGVGFALSWPSNIVCRLQTLTDPAGLAHGMSSGWVDVPGATSPWVVIPDPGMGSAFFRLVSP